MSDLDSEILAVKAIYGEAVLTATTETNVFVLSVPSHSVALRLRFPPDYPNTHPEVEGTESVGPEAPKGYGSAVLSVARKTLERVWNAGEVCIYDLIQELEGSLEPEASGLGGPSVPTEPQAHAQTHELASDEPFEAVDPRRPNGVFPPPVWRVSAPTTVHKSTFIARTCPVSSPAQAKAYITTLLSSDRKVAKATHNITAYRIRHRTPGLHTDTPTDAERTIIYQDCDDDGETAAGGRLLHLLQVMDVWGVLVMVSRWYGGVKLGPDRFKIIGEVARGVLVEGGWGGGRRREEGRGRKGG